MPTLPTPVCSYCGLTIPYSTQYYVLKKIGESSTTTYCATDYGLHGADDLASGLQSFGSVQIWLNLTPESA